MNRADRILLRCYPPSFRARYGEELRALMHDLPSSPRSTFDLASGVLRAWVAPRFVGADGVRLRMQASVSTTWFAWCIGFLIAPTMAKALLDPPAQGTPTAAVMLVHIGTGAFVLGWLAAGAGVVCVLARGVVVAAKSHPRAVLGPLLVPLILGFLVVAALVVLALATQLAHSAPGIAGLALIACTVLAAAFLVALGAGPAAGLRRARLTTRALRPATVLAPIVAAALMIATGSGLVAAFVADNGALLGSVVPMILALIGSGLAALVATVSSLRGVRALRSAAT